MTTETNTAIVIKDGIATILIPKKEYQSKNLVKIVDTFIELVTHITKQFNGAFEIDYTNRIKQSWNTDFKLIDVKSGTIVKVVVDLAQDKFTMKFGNNYTNNRKYIVFPLGKTIVIDSKLIKKVKTFFQYVVDETIKKQNILDKEKNEEQMIMDLIPQFNEFVNKHFENHSFILDDNILILQDRTYNSTEAEFRFKITTEGMVLVQSTVPNDRFGGKSLIYSSDKNNNIIEYYEQQIALSKKIESISVDIQNYLKTQNSVK